ncbi:MAG: DUF4392 domain-containing protein [Dehalococcoidia bacterium]
MTIEDIILSQDNRGVSQLRYKLPPDYCEKAARFILETRGSVVILTGFYTSPSYETDGPAGAVVLGRALETLGFKVFYVTDGCTDMMRKLVRGPEGKVIDFPVSDHESSQRLAEAIFSYVRPGLAVAIERCAFNQAQKYINMHGRDITEHTAKLDYLFLRVNRTVGVGDGGNELGMGVLYDAIAQVPTLVKDPATTSATHLVIASVSNWGAYGLVGYISILSGINLLPSTKEEQSMVKTWVDMGGVDGLDGERAYKVDGFSLEENSAVLQAIQSEVAAAGVK